MGQRKAHLASDTGDIIGYAGDYCIQTLSTPELIKDEWVALQRENTACIYQNYDWIRIACQTLEQNNSILIVTGRLNDKLHFILPLVSEDGLSKTLRWIGGTHANICSGIFSEEFLKSAAADVMPAALKVIGKSVSGIVKTQLHNQPFTLKSYKNPMLSLPQQPSVNSMYDMDLRDGMDAILDQGSGKRKRKLWRKQNRVAEGMGGYELVSPATHADILEAIDEFIVLKGKRLTDMGIQNIFSDKKTIDFFIQMAVTPPIESGHLFKIYQLKIQNKTRAMYALGIDGDYCQAYVNAVEYDEFSDHSPGEMILYAMIEQLIADGYAKFDLGVGDERYKRSWCPGKHPLFDTNIPLSASAYPIIFGLKAKNTVKRYVRNNPELWTRLKKIRKAKASLFNKK